MAQEQLDMLDEPRVPDEPTTDTALPGDEPTNKQVVNAIVWSVNKLGAKMVALFASAEKRLISMEARLGRVEESLALLHEENGRAARSDKEETK